MTDDPRTTAERIVQFFDAWYNRCSEYRDDPIFQKARESYSRLKRTHDFATSSRIAKTEAVQEILQHG